MNRLLFDIAQSPSPGVSPAYAGWLTPIVSGRTYRTEGLALLLFLFAWQVALYVSEVWKTAALMVNISTTRVLQIISAALMCGTISFYILGHESPYATATASAGFMVLGIVALSPVARTFMRRQLIPESTWILASDSNADKLYEEMLRTKPLGDVRVVSANEIGRILRNPAFSRIVVADPRIDQNAKLTETLIDCKLRGIQIETAVQSLERMQRKIWIAGLSPDWLIFAQGFQPSRMYLGAKRLIDLALAVIVLLVMAPVMAIVALAIRLESPGAAIFSQERVGVGGTSFRVFKFRSMRQDAEKQIGPTWAKKNDDRITRLGRFLRKSRLDEIPQAFNVLRGDMSFVGPRPERPYFVNLLKTSIPYYDIRHYVRPGITGWAQVMYPYGASVEDAYQKLQYDLYYTKNASFRLDLLVLLRTIRVVLSAQGR